MWVEAITIVQVKKDFGFVFPFIEYYMISWPENTLESPPDELEEVAREREVWHLCSDCCPRNPVPDERKKMDEPGMQKSNNFIA